MATSLSCETLQFVSGVKTVHLVCFAARCTAECVEYHIQSDGLSRNNTQF